MIKSIFDKSIAHPKKTLLLWLIIFLGIALNLKPFRMLITIDGLINKNFESAIAYRNLKQTFEEGTPLLFIHKNSFSSSDLCKLRSWISNSPKEFSHISKTHSIFSLRKPTILKDKGSSFEKLLFPQLISLSCHPEQHLSFKKSEIEDSPWYGLLIKNSTFLTEMRFQSQGEHNFDSQMIPKIVERLLYHYPKELKEKTFLIGEAAYQYFMKKGLRHNNLLNGALLLLVILLMRFFLGTWKSGLIFVSTLICCALILFGAMNITKTPLDVLNNSLFILLSVASLGDFIFICHHQRQTNTSWQKSFRALLIPSFFTSLTTFLGFISLTTSDLTIIKRLGLWAALSGIIEWLVVFSLLPALLTLFRFKSSFTSEHKSYGKSWMMRLENFSLHKSFRYFFILVYILAPFSPYFFNINDNPTLLFPEGHTFRNSISELKETLGYSGEVSVVLPRSGFIEKDEQKLTELVKKFKRIENVSKVESPLELTDYFTNGFNELEKDLVLTSIKKTSAYTRLVQEDSYRLRIYLKETSLKEIDFLRKRVNSTVCKDNQCYLTGALVAYAEFSQKVPVTLLISLGTSLVLVAIVLIGLAYFSKKEGGKSFLHPLLVSGFWGVAFVLLILALSQFKLNFVTCVVLAILVGMTGDNAIHYLLATNNKLDEGITHKQGASILTTTIMSLCCVIFFFFSFEPPRILGVLLIVGLWGSLFGDLWFLKLLVSNNKKADH